MTQRRLPARVYWVRRGLLLVVVAGLVTVAGLVVRALTGGASVAASPVAGTSSTPGAAGTSAAAAPASTTQPTTPSPTPTTSAPVLPGGITDCASAALALTLTPTSTAYPTGVSAGFTVTIANVGTVACLVDAGDHYRSIVITSGTDRIWSNQDCAAADADARTLLLSPGKSDTQQLAWNLVRSAAGCPGGLPAPTAGTYVATFTVGGAQATPVTFTIG